MTHTCEGGPVTVSAEKVTVYQDAAGEWRWRAQDGNNELVADSGEGYKDRAYAIEAARWLFPHAHLELQEPDAA